MSVTKSLPMLLLSAVVLLGVGCQRPVDERNALMDQNREAQSEIDRLRAALDRSMLDIGSVNAENGRLQAENDDLRRRLADAGNAGVANRGASTGFEGIPDVEVERTDTQIAVRVPGDVLFASGQAELKGSSLATLDELAGILQSQYPSNTIRIEGYTDQDPIRRSGWADNLELSLQRAAAVHRHLATRGLSDERMYAAGFGETRLRNSKEQSRRVEIVVVLRE